MGSSGPAEEVTNKETPKRNHAKYFKKYYSRHTAGVWSFLPSTVELPELGFLIYWHPVMSSPLLWNCYRHMSPADCLLLTPANTAGVGTCPLPYRKPSPFRGFRQLKGFCQTNAGWGLCCRESGTRQLPSCEATMLTLQGHCRLGHRE